MSSVHATSFDIMRPPKPPCWRDFILSTSKNISFDGLDISEQAERILAARSAVQDVVEPTRVAVSLPGSRLSRLARRPRARIHRTRSEHVIQAEDLPESEFTATLANTDPKGLRGLVADGRLYVEENNRRCQNWLASIEAAEPLDKVDYTTDQHLTLPANGAETLDVETTDIISVGIKDIDKDHAKQAGNYLIPIYESQQGVDVEVPEETFVWSSVTSPQHQSSSLGGDSCSPCREVSLKESNDKILEKPHCPPSIPPAEKSHCPSATPPAEKPHCPTTPPAEKPHCPTTPPAEKPHYPPTTPPVFNSGRPDNSTAQTPSYENSSANCSSKVSKCGKTSCGKKLYKLCCDYQDAGSSSWRENDCPGGTVNGAVDNKVNREHDHIQELDFSLLTSLAPTKSRLYSRSKSLPSAT